MNYKTVTATDQGKYREKNQDSLLVCEKKYLEKEVVLAVVCDGMGGLNYGEVASHMGVESCEKWFYSFWSNKATMPTTEMVIKELATLIADINRKVFEYSLLSGEHMGTTLSAIMLFDNKYVIGHVGDSRIYGLKKGKLIQLTEDHSLVAKEVQAGVITEAGAKTDRRKHLLTRCIGLKEKVYPQLLCGEICEGNAFLVCSDGLWNRLDDQELQHAVSSNNINLNQLIKNARSRNEKDNISVIAVTCNNKKQNLTVKNVMRFVVVPTIAILIGFLILKLIN